MGFWDFFKRNKCTEEIDEFSQAFTSPEEYFILEMRIRSSTIPPSPDFKVLNDDEIAFFNHFCSALTTAKLNPSRIVLTRLSNGCFNVDYDDICYVGKINLYKTSNPTSYAVIKQGNKRATKIFNSIEDAQHFIDVNQNYEIQERVIHHETYMHYFIGSSTFKELHNPSLQECIDTIPRWIKYIKYCKRQP
ncbi:MAG: hypothetical protein IJO55_00380 [Lachnospiraceae bacterium]|nr:hypothetical protein [Lachnospiraceae bacterium]